MRALSNPVLNLGITVAAWVRLLELPGSHSIFDTIGSSHQCGQYHFEINDGNIRWFHRNETQQTVFTVEATGGLVKQGERIYYRRGTGSTIYVLTCTGGTKSRTLSTAIL